MFFVQHLSLIPTHVSCTFGCFYFQVFFCDIGQQFLSYHWVIPKPRAHDSVFLPIFLNCVHFHFWGWKKVGGGRREEMGRVFVVTLEGNIYSCKHCGTHLALTEDVISKVFSPLFFTFLADVNLILNWVPSIFLIFIKNLWPSVDWWLT